LKFEVELNPEREFVLGLLCNFNLDGFGIGGVVVPAEENHRIDVAVAEGDVFKTNYEVLR
jgi:hypothetical protein